MNTLEEYAGSKQQMIFDKVAVHLIKQGQRSQSVLPMHSYWGGNGNKVEVGEALSCAYRGNDGLMCAVGCLINDEDYNREMEGADAQADIVMSAVEKAYGTLNKSTALMLRWLQRVHDTEPVQLWHNHLRAITEDYSLNTEALDAAVKQRDLELSQRNGELS